MAQYMPTKYSQTDTLIISVFKKKKTNNNTLSCKETGFKKKLLLL